MHYCYMVRAGKYLKVGYTCDITERLKDIQTMNAYKVELLSQFPFDSEKPAREMERHFHARLSRYRIRGEWFRLKESLALLEKQAEHA